MYIRVSPSIGTRSEIIEDSAGGVGLFFRAGESLDDPELLRYANAMPLLRELTTLAAAEARLHRKVYTYTQAAAMLHVSTRWLQRRVGRGMVPAERLGGLGVRFTGADIAEIAAMMHRGELDRLRVPPLA